VRSVGLSGLTLRVLARAYPSADDWKALQNALPKIVAGADHGADQPCAIGEIWDVAIHHVPPDVLPISENHTSYQAVILAPYHQNEAKNLLDKLDDAAVNARKHAAAPSDVVARAVLVRLPETISIEVCSGWALNYVTDNPRGPLDLIMLYQPTVIDNPDGSSVIDHALVPCPAESFSRWVHSGRKVGINLPLGVHSGSPTSRRIAGVENMPGIDGMYAYQRGEFFTVSEHEHGSETNHPINNLASGIVRHSVIRIPNMEGELVIKGIFPPEKSLSLFA
jgi:hypothetical protein